MQFNPLNKMSLAHCVLDNLSAPAFINCLSKGKGKGLRFVNKALIRKLGYQSSSELIGRPLYDILAAEQVGGRTRDEMMAEGKKILAKHKFWRGGLTYQCKNGSTFETSAIVTMSVHGDMPYTISILANAELISEFTSEFETSVGECTDEIAETVGNLENTTSQLLKQMQIAVAEAEATAQNAQTSAGNANDVAAQAQELQQSTSDISQKMKMATEITTKGVQQAVRSDQLVNEMSSAAGKIGEVVDLIKSIADQTNLLALNAAIEAARAGEAGRGFAVVANEVKNLASQTSEATDNISQQITLVTSTIQETISGLQTTSEVIKQINDISQEVEERMVTQSNSTQVMNTHLSELANLSDSACSSATQIQQINADSQQSATEMGSQVGQMSEVSHHLKMKINGFVDQLKQRG